MNTETSTDIAALVGEMEAPQCDHSQHGHSEFHSDEPASHYIKSHCRGCVERNRVYPACPRFVASLREYPFIRCNDCGEAGKMSEFLTVLGPVNQ